jgi:hypothetical protein
VLKTPLAVSDAATNRGIFVSRLMPGVGYP